jgi:hypothetical protein
MGKLEEAKGILSAIGMPNKQTNDRSAYVLLALADIKEDTDWNKAVSRSMRLVDIMKFMAEYYNKHYMPNSRETIRKDTVHLFVEAAVAHRNSDAADRPTNSPNFSYCLTQEMVGLLKTYGTNKWQAALNKFTVEKGTLAEKYSQQRDLVKIPVMVNGKAFSFSAGVHNKLQKSVIEEFAALFAKESEVLYIGDAENKDLIKNREKLKSLGVIITDHDKLPDIILYSEKQDWLYFIETVTNVGAITVKRMNEIEKMTVGCKSGKIYVTAFPDKKTYKKFVDELAWETEVWIAETPQHLIHLNGDKFIGPR